VQGRLGKCDGAAGCVELCISEGYRMRKRGTRCIKKGESKKKKKNFFE